MEGNMVWIGIFTLVMIALGVGQFVANRRKRRKG